MARGTLHSPKPEGQRRRRNAPAHAETILPRDDEVRGQELAELTAGRAFGPETVAWFETWRRSPQAAVFEATDWLRLATLAPIVDAYWRRPSAAALSEIRMNEERLGATVVDRMRAPAGRGRGRHQDRPGPPACRPTPGPPRPARGQVTAKEAAEFALLLGATKPAKSAVAVSALTSVEAFPLDGSSGRWTGASPRSSRTGSFSPTETRQATRTA